MANELAVVEGNGSVVVAEDKSPKATRTRAQLLAPLGIPDDSSKSLAAVIKGYLKAKGLKPKDVQAEYLRILKEETHGAVLAKIEWAKSQGYALEYKSAKDAKDGSEKFSVNFIPPKAPKQLTASEQEKIFSLVGKDSAMGKQLFEHLQKAGMLSKPKTVSVESEVVSVS